MTFEIPAAVLAQHLAVIGKTGSGKSSVAKLCVEQVVADGARVCILDPIKSDWWGLISSADGKRPGLPFHILGGPHGHVPLHDGAGKAVAEVVANGTLPLSIIDMADFGPGGQARFFVDFAPMLMRKMRGVVYLVIEEAHLFAPKERSGIGAENMSIHWAKTLATAGRSKGIRLIVVTHAVQSLHNALLSSCDTLITLRLTAPAYQEPVIKWLKANTDKDTAQAVASSLSSLPTGEGWICSGEAQLFERVKFPRIKTYDNSATPTGDAALDQVKTAPVDADKLRSIIGDAVKTAEANDPAVLKKRIAELERLVAMKPAAVAADPTALDRATKEGYDAGKDGALKAARSGWNALLATMRLRYENAGHEIFKGAELEVSVPTRIPPPRPLTSVPLGKAPAPVQRPAPRSGNGHASPLSKAALKILAVLSQFPDGCTAGKLTLLTGYRYSGGFQNALSELRTSGYIEGRNAETMRITDAGVAQGPFPELPQGDALVQYWLNHPSFSKPAKLILGELANGDPMTSEQLCKAIGYSYSGSFQNALSELRTAGVLIGRNTEAMRISPEIVS